MRLRDLALLLATAAQHACFAVTPTPTCSDRSGLYEPGHVCMPQTLELQLGDTPWLLRRAVFDDDGIDDLALGVGPTGGQRTLLAVTELGEDGVLTEVARQLWLVDFAPSWTYGGAEGPQDLVALLDSGVGVGELAIWGNGGDVFMGATAKTYALETSLKVPCGKPSALAPIGDGVTIDLGWGVACDAGPASLLPDLGFLLSPVIEPSGVFEAYGDPRFHTTHAVVTTRLNDGPYPDMAFAAVPADGNSDILVLTYDDDDVVRPQGSFIAPEQGLISRIYAADLDGDGVEEFVALHRKGDIVTISRRTREDPPTFAPITGDAQAVYAIPTPLAAAFGDFSGDGELDMAVANDNEDGTTALAVFIRWPDQKPGSFAASRGASLVFPAGEPVVDVVALRADDDAAPDLAVALATPAGGVLRVYLNRSLDPD